MIIDRRYDGNAFSIARKHRYEYPHPTHFLSFIILSSFFLHLLSIFLSFTFLSFFPLLSFSLFFPTLFLSFFPFLFTFSLFYLHARNTYFFFSKVQPRFSYPLTPRLPCDSRLSTPALISNTRVIINEGIIATNTRPHMSDPIPITLNEFRTTNNERRE